MEIRRTSLLFGEKVGDTATAEAEMVFARDVLQVTAGITGYSALFENEDDHHLGRLELEISSAIDDSDATKVRLSGRLGLRDWSNEFDDAYSGVVDIAVLADLEAVTPPGPGEARGDLVIVGAEVTQAVQHFWSAEHLDAPNVFPDNSIRLIAGKPTVVRLYVDYDRNSGLPLIPWLSGSLAASGPSGSATPTPIQAMVPRRATAIDRGSRGHTLNFLLSDIDSMGQLNLVATVFDAADPTQMSEPFEQTITFVQQPALRVLAVGIEYTGPDVVDGASDADLAAPTQAEFIDTLEFTDRIYPVPGVMLTDYRTMEYDGDMRSDISQGCDEFGDLKDAVADFAGDSDDVVYGLFGPGVDTGSVGGCGGGGVGVGRVLAGGTTAHEIGHALGRQHAPCDNVTRCATPLNTDSGYPDYSGYDSDSIGEYGFDPTTMLGTVKNPSSAHDIMGYSGDRWISPYTYKALMSAIPGTGISGASASSAESAVRLGSSEHPLARGTKNDGEWIPVKQQKLFLRLDIEREGPVLQHSFHYAARPRIVTGTKTDYVLELRAGDQVVRRTCLYADDVGCNCGCGCGCDGQATVRVRQAVPFDERATTAVLLKCEDEIDRWPIPKPPEVDVVCEADEDPSFMWLRWKVRPRSESDEKPEGDEKPEVRERHVSLVQWRDRGGTWRGVAARLRGDRLRVPRRIAGMGEGVDYRVLVTTGISTGVGYCDEDCGDERAARLAPAEVAIAGIRPGRGVQELPRIVSATVVGGGDRRAAIRWYDGSGAELARGTRLDLAILPPGGSVVTVRDLGSGVPTSTATWHLERTIDGRFLVHLGQVGGEHPTDDEEPHRDHDHGGHGHHQQGRGHHHHSHRHDDSGGRDADEHHEES